MVISDPAPLTEQSSKESLEASLTGEAGRMKTLNQLTYLIALITVTVAQAQANVYPILLLDYRIQVGTEGNLHSDPRAVLGDNDHQTSLGDGGWLIVQMAQAVNDREGIDLIIEESPTGPAEGYEVFVADSTLEFVPVGDFYGTAKIDLGAVGINKIHYVYIHDNPSDDSQSTDAPGVDISRIIGMQESSYE